MSEASAEHPEPQELDRILELQLGVAWAGETKTDPPRLGWWRTAMSAEFGGEDLLRRLTPKTWQWATLECCRAAAKRVDDAARSTADDADHLISLYRLGFELDERLDERLLELKQSGVPPTEVFPELAELFSAWSKSGLEAFLADGGEASFTTTATGRRLKGEMPTDHAAVVSQLAAALLPLADKYPLPYFRVGR